MKVIFGISGNYNRRQIEKTLKSFKSSGPTKASLSKGYLDRLGENPSLKKQSRGGLFNDSKKIKG